MLGSLGFSPLLPVPQFIPRFLSQSTRRVKELKQALRDMPKVYSTDNELWGEYRKIISAIREELKDLLAGGSGRAMIGKAHSSSNVIPVIPHVTGMYKGYAARIRKVGRHQWSQKIPGLASSLKLR